MFITYIKLIQPKILLYYLRKFIGVCNTKCSIALTVSMRDNECIGKSQMDGSNISIL